MSVADFRDYLGRLAYRFAFFDAVAGFFGRISDAAFCALILDRELGENLCPKELLRHRKIIDQTSQVLSYSAVSINLIRLVCHVFTLPFNWGKAVSSPNRGVAIAESLVATSFVAHRALTVTQYFANFQASTRSSMGTAMNGLLGFGVIGQFFLCCYKAVYKIGHGVTSNQHILEIVRSGMDLICWIMDVVKSCLRSPSLGIASAAIGLADAVVWVVSTFICDSFEEGAASPITL